MMSFHHAISTHSRTHPAVLRSTGSEKQHWDYKQDYFFHLQLLSIPHAREKIIFEHELMIERRADMQQNQ